MRSATRRMETAQARGSVLVGRPTRNAELVESCISPLTGFYPTQLGICMKACADGGTVADRGYFGGSGPDPRRGSPICGSRAGVAPVRPLANR
jgi:hypothetical protein